MNLMIDLETLGVNNDCPVISIGVVAFDINGIHNTFYRVLDVAEQIDGTRKVDAQTIKWWMEQEDAAKRVFKDNSCMVGVALSEFTDWLVDIGVPTKDIKPWGNGSNFDIEILESLLKDYSINVPWRFWNIRDLRTFKEFTFDGKGVKREGTHHNALDDAIHQANIVIEGMRRSK